MNEINSSIKEETVKRFRKAGEQYEKKTKAPVDKKVHNDVNKKNNNNYKLVSKYKCKGCPKATSISFECIKCGHPSEKIFCDDDLEKGEHTLRDPNFLICKSSPQYEIVFRKTV